MDLGAYAQIEDLGKLAKANGIDVPRLRGYRLMVEEEPVSQEGIREMMNDAAIRELKNLCDAEPFWSAHPKWRTYSSYTDYVEQYFLGPYKDTIRWDRIHGWKRKVLKFEIKKAKRRIQKQYDMWNKYAGQENVLYIHSRIGGNNWSYFEGDKNVASQPWFLDRVDDYFDSTYCDIYARITIPEYLNEMRTNGVDTSVCLREEKE